MMVQWKIGIGLVLTAWMLWTAASQSVYSESLPTNVDSWVVISSEPLKFNSTFRKAVAKMQTPQMGRHRKRSLNDPEPMHLYRIKNVPRRSSIMAGILSRNVPFSIEPNIKFHINTNVATSSWGLDMINQVSLPLDGFMTRHPLINGTDQHVFIIDTGIYNHPSFYHSVEYDFDAIDSPMCMCDPNSHGTHVAGLACSMIYGVAPYATIHSIRVLDADGSGYLDDVVAGLQWIYYNGPNKPSVVAMSLGSSSGSAAMTNIINALVNNKKYIVSVAAGNDGGDACNTYPAWLPNTFAIGATNNQDKLAYFTNAGNCVSAYAPGDSITSCANSGSGSAEKSGTSMAQPFAAGTFALILQTQVMYGITGSPESIFLQSLTYYNTKIKAPRLYLQLDALYQSIPAGPPTNPPPPPQLPPPPPPPPPPQPQPIRSNIPPFASEGNSSKLDLSAFLVQWINILMVISTMGMIFNIHHELLHE